MISRYTPPAFGRELNHSLADLSEIIPIFHHETIVLKSMLFPPEFRQKTPDFLSYEKWLPLTMVGMYLTGPDECEVVGFLIHYMINGN